MDKESRKRYNRLKNLFRKIQQESQKLPIKALEFKEGTTQVSEAIMQTVAEKKFVTKLQIQAFENILAGIKQWTKRRKKK